MTQIRYLIAEDEDPAAEELQHFLCRYPFMLSIGRALNGLEALRLCHEGKPDVVFLDINMPSLSGIELAAQLKMQLPELKIIFTTAYGQHALKAFEIAVDDYILKPYDEKRLDLTINRLLQELSTSSKHKTRLLEDIKSLVQRSEVQQACPIKIPCDQFGKILLLDPHEIYFIAIEGEQTLVYTYDACYSTHFTLQQLETRTGFFRTHRSFLVNTQHIQAYYPWVNGSYELVLNNSKKTTVPLSRYNVKRMKEFFGL